MRGGLVTLAITLIALSSCLSLVDDQGSAPYSG